MKSADKASIDLRKLKHSFKIQKALRTVAGVAGKGRIASMHYEKTSQHLSSEYGLLWRILNDIKQSMTMTSKAIEKTDKK